MKTIPNELKKHRKLNSLTQAQVADMLGFTTTERISKWEKGRAFPHVVNLIKLSQIFKVHAEELYGELVHQMKENMTTGVELI